MLRRVGVIFLSVVLILSISPVHSAGESFVPKTPTEGWRKLTETPLPQGLEDWKWAGAFDFAELRDVWLPTMGGMRLGAYALAGTAMGLLFAWGMGKLIVIGKGLSYTTPASVTAGQGAFTGFAGSIAGGIHDIMHPNSLPGQAEDLKTKLGISDYYVFGQAGKALPFTRPDIPGVEKLMGSMLVPLGAWMKLRVNPAADDGRYPTLYRLRVPELDFSKLGSRVWERSLSGQLKPTTVPFVFGYEAAQGRIIPYRRGEKLPKFSVSADTSAKEGRILGSFRLRSDPEWEMAGLREVHLCSPANEGFAVKGLDDYVFAIVINKETVTVKGPPPALRPKVEEELEVRVHIQGFHTGKARIRTSDGRQYPWEEIAESIFRGAALQGAGITGTYINHSRRDRCTFLRATLTKTGEVNAVLQTIHGPVTWKVTTVEKDETPVRFGALTKDDCPSPPEPNLYLFKADVEYDAEVNVDCLECKYGLFNGEKPRRYEEEQRPWVASLFGWTKTNLFAFDSIEKAKEMFTEAKPKLREGVEEEIRKQREDPGGGPPLEVKWDESDPDALIGKCIDSSVADRKLYMKVGWFRYKNCFFIIGTHKDRDQDWVRRVFDKLKKNLEALVDRKGHEDRPPA